MKTLLRSGPVQALLGLILGGYLWLVLRTVRWTIVNRPRAQQGFHAGKASRCWLWASRA